MVAHHRDHVQDDEAHDDHVELFVGNDAEHYRKRKLEKYHEKEVGEFVFKKRMSIHIALLV